MFKKIEIKKTKSYFFLVLGIIAIFFLLFLFFTRGSTSSPKVLKFGVMPSSSLITKDKLASLSDLLTQQMKQKVELIDYQDYTKMTQDLAKNKLDVAFVSPEIYVQTQQTKIRLLLQTTRFDVDSQGNPSDKLVNFYRSEVLVRNDAGINDPTQLVGKRIAIQQKTSASGYLFPVFYLKNETGFNIQQAITSTFSTQEQAIDALESKQVDAAFVFQDARNSVKSTTPSIFDDTKILFLTGEIPNDVIIARNNLSTKIMDQFTSALQTIGNNQGSSLVQQIFSTQGFTTTNDANFDIVRQIQQNAD